MMKGVFDFQSKGRGYKFHKLYQPWLPRVEKEG
jgi:hypothetical protein